ncbi:GAF domain-containing sensor histidine kinase [Roseiflexus sp.]|uniref:GAF domain-containing sensor histidine kinase n=1 Tax=Roseiflexus sp. TaxID=2562120 RepID=UPI002583FF1D|nr:GAF domain-containing sensor histidine kinase [Roseiflexus sp.]
MAPLLVDQRQLQTLSQLISAGGHQDVHELLQASLERLVAFWPAQGGALLYHAPHGEVIRLHHGVIDSEAGALIAEARETFARREEGREPTIGYYTLDDERKLLELPLSTSSQTVGLLHLVVLDAETERPSPAPDEDLAMLLVRAIGGEADKLARLRRAEQDLRELHLLYQVGQALASNLDLSSLLNDIRNQVPQAMGAERCSIMLLDEHTRELILELPDPHTGEQREFRIPLDRGIAGWVATNGIGQIVNDVEQDPRWFDGVARDVDFETRQILCAPMRIGDRVVGVMQVLNKRDGTPFDDQDLRLLMTLATQAAIAVENARLVRSLKEERDRLLAKEAEVRAAIARDLHDGPTQSIAAIAMNIEFIKKLLRAMPERVEGELEVLAELVQKTAYDIRTLLFELRPLGLETQGLLSTLQQYVARFRDPAGVMKLRLEAPSSIPRLPVEVEGAIFIIIQEAVNNARKHARTDEVVIYLYLEEGQLVASVRDRGRGFNPAAVESSYNTRGSLGLLNMRERARLIGGECRIRSAEGEGTTVELRVPLA